MEFPSGALIQVPQCLALAGALRDPAIVASLRHIDMNILQDRLAKAQRDVEEAEAFWKRMEDVPQPKVINVNAPLPPEAIEALKKPGRVVAAPPPAPVPAPEPEPTDAADVCAVCRKNPHAKWCKVGAPEDEPAKDPAPAHAKAPRFAEKTCCGSKGVRHKNGCPKVSGASADPEPAEEEEEEEDKNDEDVSDSAADEKPEPKDAPEQPEEQAYSCRECGNARMEPYGTNPLALFCPNELGDDGDKHVYELKEE